MEVRDGGREALQDVSWFEPPAYVTLSDYEELQSSVSFDHCLVLGRNITQLAQMCCAIVDNGGLSVDSLTVCITLLARHVGSTAWAVPAAESSATAALL